jgi:hypothetical protein
MEHETQNAWSNELAANPTLGRKTKTSPVIMKQQHIPRPIQNINFSKNSLGTEENFFPNQTTVETAMVEYKLPKRCKHRKKRGNHRKDSSSLCLQGTSVVENAAFIDNDLSYLMDLDINGNWCKYYNSMDLSKSNASSSIDGMTLNSETQEPTNDAAICPSIYAEERNHSFDFSDDFEVPVLSMGRKKSKRRVATAKRESTLRTLRKFLRKSFQFPSNTSHQQRWLRLSFSSTIQ